MKTIYEIAVWIQINFDKIFTNELNDWTDEEETWPTDRTYKLFTEWFEVEYSSMVLDLEDNPLEKVE